MKTLYCRLLAALLVLSASTIFATPAKADSLTGDTISGSLTGLFSEITSSSPFASSAVVGPGVEFTGTLADNNFQESFNIAVDLTANGFTVAVTSPLPTANLEGPPLYQIVLSGFPSSVDGFSLAGYTCNASIDSTCGEQGSVWASSGLTSDTFSNSTLTLNFFTFANAQTYTFTENAATSPVPEPSTLALLGTGILGAAGVIRRRMIRA